MNIEKWLSENTDSLCGKTVAITGSTGGIGLELTDYLAGLGADLVLITRSTSRSEDHRRELMGKYPEINIKCIHADLEDILSVKAAISEILTIKVDIFIHNAGAYSIPRHKCSTGYDNVFQINFASPYYMIRELMPMLKECAGRVIIVGSIAHNYSKINPVDVDFSCVFAASKVYGNAKRYLMFSLYELFKGEDTIGLAVTHPGITFTNITAHYPKLIFAIIKHPMKIIFMKPKHAALCVLKGAFENTDYHTWVGPEIFGIWGKPKKSALKTCSVDESKRIAILAEEVYQRCKNIN